ncbi:MAG: rod shape-determining protein MreC [Bacteriovoracaceae bacterium]|nr:rod shape-determining protein MreC [Bacteriovoracaceae bacterium]HPV28089.1 rod shape-determining protein MreC [Deltaproteobacteria bacterium]
MGRSGSRVILLIGAAALILVLLSTGQYSSSSLGISCVREGYGIFEKVIRSPFSFIAGIWNHYIFLVNTSHENEVLRKEIDELRVRSMNLEDIKNENQRLRAMLEFKEAFQDFSLIPASVLSQDITHVFKTVLIDKGSRSGFGINTPILNPSGVVGRVIAVSPHTAQVLLITDPNSSIPALIESSRVKGIVKGREESLLSLEYVRSTEEVNVGDCVVTSGLLGMFPKGLKIGYVREVKKDDRQIFAKIILEPCVKMEKIEEIFGIAQTVEVSD